MEKKIKHLEMIQGIISRLAGNSFFLKGWAVTLIAGVFALASQDSDKLYFIIAYIPILIFWGIDSYYLLQERLYRKLYDVVRVKDEKDVDFSMNTSLPELQTTKTKYLDCLLSVTELWFYFPLAMLTSVIIIISHVF